MRDLAQRPPLGNGTPHCFSVSTGSFAFGIAFALSFLGFLTLRGDKSSLMSSKVGGLSPRATAAAVAASSARRLFLVIDVLRTFFVSLEAESPDVRESFRFFTLVAGVDCSDVCDSE